VTRLQLTGNYFTAKGIHEVTRGVREKDELRMRSLDLSDSNINDDVLEKLVPVLQSLEELTLSDNFLTWYGVRKMTQPQRKTRKLKRLDVSRCRMNEHAFYELIPLVLRTGEPFPLISDAGETSKMPSEDEQSNVSVAKLPFFLPFCPFPQVSFYFPFPFFPFPCQSRGEFVNGLRTCNCLSFLSAQSESFWTEMS